MKVWSILERNKTSPEASYLKTKGAQKAKFLNGGRPCQCVFDGHNVVAFGAAREIPILHGFHDQSQSPHDIYLID